MIAPAAVQLGSLIKKILEGRGRDNNYILAEKLACMIDSMEDYLKYAESNKEGIDPIIFEKCQKIYKQALEERSQDGLQR